MLAVLRLLAMGCGRLLKSVSHLSEHRNPRLQLGKSFHPSAFRPKPFLDVSDNLLAVSLLRHAKLLGGRRESIGCTDRLTTIGCHLSDASGRIVIRVVHLSKACPIRSAESTHELDIGCRRRPCSAAGTSERRDLWSLSCWRRSWPSPEHVYPNADSPASLPRTILRRYLDELSHEAAPRKLVRSAVQPRAVRVVFSCACRAYG